MWWYALGYSPPYWWWVMPGIGVVFMVIVLFIISRSFIGDRVGCGMMPMDV